MKNLFSNVDYSFSHLNEEQWSILNKLIANLSISQVIWISGYLHGLVMNSNSKCKSFQMLTASDESKNVSVTPFIHDNITIIFASQTGNAQELAKKLYQFLVDEKFNARLINVADYNFKKVHQEKLLLLIISTYGEGEPPESAVMFYKYIFSHRAPSLEGVNFSIFGLGDRSYENFSKAAKDFDDRLEKLGACRIYPRVDVDLDYHQQADIWRKEIVNILKNRFMFFKKNLDDNTIDDSSNRNIDSTAAISNIVMYSNKYTKESPFSACLSVRQKITSRNAFKDVYHLEIDLSSSGMRYQPGDSLGVWYENDPNLVAELIGYCNFTGKEKINIHGQWIPCNIALQKYCELTHNTRLIARNYATLINNSKLLSLLVDDVSSKQFIASTSIVDMVRCWSPLKLLPQQFLSVLRPLTPRFYSISSSQQEVGDEVHITVGMVSYKVDGYVRTGGASGYLINQLLVGHEVRVFVVPNEGFRLPNNTNDSIIMIAAGTGVAPFRAFMQQRLLDGALGKNWLFFGNLCFVDDFLYQREWQGYMKEGLLTDINTAWSRDQKNKVYVQDKILQNGLKVWRWIQNGAYIYICGDASRMAAGVEKSLIQLGVEYGNMNFKESCSFFSNMRDMRRYQRDVY